MRRSITRLLVLVAWATVLAVFLKNAWVSEDAYIAFRSVEQLFAGHGLRWNPHERVQVFTSPLWMMLLVSARLFTHNLFLAALALSAGCLGVLLFLTQRLMRSPLHFVVACAVLVCSRTFFDFTSSGLEHPLAYVLIALAFGLYARAVSGDPDASGPDRGATAFFFALGLAALCRHDLLTVLLPPAADLLWTRRRGGWRHVLTLAAIATAPLIAWSAVSLFYYGFPFPNTAYAKLNVGIPRVDLMWRGLQYLVITAQMDPITGAVLGAAFVRLALAGRSAQRWWAVGIATNLAYVVSVGGDFMLGRFLSFSFLVAVLAVGHWGPGFEWRRLGVEARFSVRRPGRVALALAGALALYAAINPRTPVRTGPSYSDELYYGDVADERGFYFQSTSLWQYALWRFMGDEAAHGFPAHRFAKTAEKMRNGHYTCVVTGNVGMTGYGVSLDTIIIDPFALTDPLLARLPAESNSRIGHYTRPIPEGYDLTVCGRPAAIKDAGINAFQKRLALITQAPLLAPGRLRTIVAMNLGLYDKYLRNAWAERSRTF